MSAGVRHELILASASPRRSELLGRLGLAFQVQPSQGEEEKVDQLAESEAGSFVERLALAKASEVAEKAVPGELVLGADTLVWLDGAVLNKPRDAKDAEELLARLSGREHRVYTGVALVRAGEGLVESLHELTKVRFYPLSQSEIRAYVESGEPLDKAGAYGAQGLGSLLIERIEGDYFNVVGLPVSRVHRLLKKHGVDCLEGRR
jgi:septum formation protein